mgnify:CR=1 FL=1
MTVQEKCFELDGGFTTGMVKEMVAEEGMQFSLNGSNTGSALCLKVDVENNTVYYQECYSEYGNFTGKNRYGNPRTDKLNHPTPGLNTMSLHQFYGAAIGWV